MPRLNKSDIARQKLLDTGLVLFARNGYHGVGIKQIVDSVQIPKGSFYNYFKSKEDFAVEIIRRHSADFWQQWRDNFNSTTANPLIALRDCFYAMISDHTECSVNTFFVVSLIVAEISENSEACRAAIKLILADMCSNLAEQIRKAQLGGYARTDCTAEEMALLFWDAWQGSMVRMKIDNSPQPVSQCVALFFDTIFR